MSDEHKSDLCDCDHTREHHKSDGECWECDCHAFSLVGDGDVPARRLAEAKRDPLYLLAERAVKALERIGDELTRLG